MTRTPVQIFSDHFEALTRKDVPLILQDFAASGKITLQSTWFTIEPPA